jgi:O-antigen biosynthesis protein WbqP
MPKHSKRRFTLLERWEDGSKAMYRSFGKRLFDIILSGLALTILSPFMLVIAMAICQEDKGPALYRQTRVGRYGRPFTVLKFRSMPVNTGDVPSVQASAVTITQIGRFIRRTNIDELPQLFNILKGDMSIVGPRPALASQEELCTLREQLGALRCAPGLTGLAQINSYDYMPETEKVALDATYCAGISLFGDLGIVLRTFGYLRKPPPIY